MSFFQSNLLFLKSMLCAIEYKNSETQKAQSFSFVSIFSIDQNIYKVVVYHDKFKAH